MKQATAYLSKQSPLMLAAGAALLVWALYYLGKKAVGDVAKVAGGLVSGDNAITKDTAYEGKGVLGTLGGIFNSALPFLDNTGEWIGGMLSSDAPGEWLYYIVTFPFGERHSIPSLSVARDGRFTYQGKAYILGMQAGQRVARYAT